MRGRVSKSGQSCPLQGTGTIEGAAVALSAIMGMIDSEFLGSNCDLYFPVKGAEQ